MRFELTGHAIERYRDRVRPTLDLPAARVELERMVAAAETVCPMPEWALEVLSEDHADVRRGEWACVLTDDIVMPVREHSERGTLIGMTVLVRGSLTDGIRADRNMRKAHKRNVKILRGKKGGKQGKRAYQGRGRTNFSQDQG